MAVATPSLAGSLPSAAAGIKAAAPDNVTDVRWRRGYGGWGWHGGAGLAAGALLGAGIAAATAPRYYYPHGAYAYGEPYAYGGPVYVAPYSSYGYPYQCGHDGGYGRWDYSQC
jgi:hypothetical protein